MAFIPNHLHLLVRGHFSNPPKEVSVLNQWFKELVKKVNMVVVAGPTSVYVNDPGNEGLTGTVTLATSHASFHCWQEDTPPMFQFDLYSCSEFTVETVMEHLNQFDLISYSYVFIDRNQDDFFVISRGKVIK
jgi:S-adenosylmethionine/arginine decarboxylase-like enzyme